MTLLIWFIFSGRNTMMLNSGIEHLPQCFVISVDIFTLSISQKYCTATVTGSLNRVSAKILIRKVYCKLHLCSVQSVESFQVLALSQQQLKKMFCCGDFMA